MQDIDRLIDELLARELRPNTREDLGVFRQELAAGTLSAGDATYIRALHARVVGGGVPISQEEQEDDGQAAAKSTEVEMLQAELAESRRREQALAAERDQLQSTVAGLRRELDELRRDASKG